MNSYLTVITQAETYDLTTLTTAKEELGITSAEQDNKLTRWIHEASEIVADYCGRVFALERVKETFLLDQPTEGGLRLSRYPVSLVHTLTVDGAELAITDWLADELGGIVFRLSGNTRAQWGGKKVEVEYSAGFDLLDGLPRAIERATLSLLRYRNSASSRDPAIRSESLSGVYDVSYWVGSIPGGTSSSMPPEVGDLLEAHRDRSASIA